MKIKHKLFDKVSVFFNGKEYIFDKGLIEIDDTTGKLLLKANNNLEEIIEESTEEIPVETPKEVKEDKGKGKNKPGAQK